MSTTPKIQVSIQEHQEKLNRCSDTTNNTNSPIDNQFFRFSQNQFDEFKNQKLTVLANHSTVINLLKKQTKTPSISQNLHKKAINWLITFCWTHDYSDQVLWYSIGYFYAYLNSTLVKKGKLSVLLISLVNISLKLVQPLKLMKIVEMKNILNNVFDNEDFYSIEEQVLELFEFDLFFEINMKEIVSKYKDSQKYFYMMFICEALCYGNCESIIDGNYLKQISSYIQCPLKQSFVKQQLRKLLNEEKYFLNLKLKYGSKFQVQILIRMIKQQV